MWKFYAVAGLVVAGAAIMFLPVGGDASEGGPTMHVNGINLSGYDTRAPAEPLNLAFLHHSVGAQLLAARGPVDGKAGEDPTHPNGGGLARVLAANNYRLHEATFGSTLGEHTDLFDWLPKFRANMDAILALKRQNDRLGDGERNRVVMFKSCFPNNEFVGDGSGEGKPAGPELTEANARATMDAVRLELAGHPGVLFVYLTAPPVAPRSWSEPAWKWLAKKVRGQPTHDDDVRRSGEIARRFNNWMKDPAGWLKGYQQRNIVVFDFYDALTDHGASNFSRYPTGDGFDSHPSSEGNTLVAPELVSFLNRAVRYAGLVR